MNGYEYGNTRLRARRKRLFGRADLEQLLVSPSVEYMLGALADSPYGEDVAAALPRADGLLALDQALSSNLARSLQTMYLFYTGRPAEHVALLLDQWDLHNLLALLRISESLEDRADLARLLVPAGRLDTAALAAVADESDTIGRLDLIITWDLLPSVRELGHARAAYAASGDIAPVEHAITQAFADRISQVLGDSVKGSAAVLRNRIDVLNLLLALRRREARRLSEPVPAAEGPVYLEGGVVRVGFWEGVATTDDVEEIAASVTALPNLPGWAPPVEAWAGNERLTQLADGLQRAGTRAAVGRFATGDPLGFDIPLAYASAKEAEVRNLRLVGRAVDQSLPSAVVLDRIEAAA